MTGIAAAPPERIVSMNVCTDLLVWKLAARSRIASLSYIAADARTSPIANEIDGIHLNDGTAEEIIVLKPDLVVTNDFGFRPTVTILRRLGYTVLELPMAAEFGDILSSYEILGRALQETEKARALIERFERVLEERTYKGAGSRPLFVNFDVNGWTTGRTGMLADIVHRAGLSTPGDHLGFRSAGRLSLESLLLLKPALIDLGYSWNDPPALASEHHRHPALRALLQHTATLDVPDSAWLCGGEHSLEALAMLRNARQEYVAKGRDPQS
jgi:iron complex transport system substrate-binding protein